MNCRVAESAGTRARGASEGSSAPVKGSPKIDLILDFLWPLQSMKLAECNRSKGVESEKGPENAMNKRIRVITKPLHTRSCE